LKAVQELYEEGTFTELGLSNYAAWEVMQIYHICKMNQYVLPTLYQGMYNALTRDVERELLPCLKQLNMRFYAYNPLCGGLLSGHHQFEKDPEQGSRFDPKTSQGERYRGRYWNQTYFTAIEELKKVVVEKHGVALASAAHRWMFHHSKMDAVKGDGVVIGASSVKHAEMNLKDCEAGPLDLEIVEAFDRAYLSTKSIQTSYFR
jgi:aflatoxin B1 aldehyde reductase